MTKRLDYIDRHIEAAHMYKAGVKDANTRTMINSLLVILETIASELRAIRKEAEHE